MADNIQEGPLGTARPIRIITIGAGASGINMIHTLRTTLTNYTHTVYEKNSKVGGTWYENRYPGCKCDVPSHNYQFSWKPNPGWSEFFAKAGEIEEYLEGVCDEGMRREIKLEHKVVEARWSGKRWDVRVEDLKSGRTFDDSCDFLLDASGILNNWKWPDIPGLKSFKGDLIHSADWPSSFSHGGKTVAVIGNGSTGVQIVPALQPDVKEVVHFVRSPTWVTPTQQQMLPTTKAAPILAEIEMGGDAFTLHQIEKFKADPEYYLRFVKAVEEQVNSKFPILIKDSEAAKQAKAMLTKYMTVLLKNDTRLCAALIPTFPVGCRRLTPAPGYLESLTASNVRVVTESINEVVPSGLRIETGEVIKVDALICATGFDVSFCPRFPIVGKDNQNLQELWSTGLPKAYMSCAVPDFPNFFMFLGPNAPVGHGSILTITEHISKYIAKAIRKCQTEGIIDISPSKVATQDYNEHIDNFMPRTAWAGTCRSWFKNGKETGPVTALHPGSRIHWFHMLENFRGEDFEYEWEGGKRYRYLGNGLSTKELGDGDPTWYLGKLQGD